VCAAADVRDVPPREVRALVAAAFARAHELGFETEAVAKALARHLPAPATVKP
jgi:UDP-N-acetylmuramyl pentapeptide synthase